MIAARFASLAVAVIVVSGTAPAVAQPRTTGPPRVVAPPVPDAYRPRAEDFVAPPPDPYAVDVRVDVIDGLAYAAPPPMPGVQRWSPRVGLLVAGAIVFGAGWIGGMVFGGMLARDARGDGCQTSLGIAQFAPVLGPLVGYGTLLDCNLRSGADGAWATLEAPIVVAQIVGSALLVAGTVGRRRKEAAIELVPTAGPSGASLTMSIRF